MKNTINNINDINKKEVNAFIDTYNINGTDVYTNSNKILNNKILFDKIGMIKKYIEPFCEAVDKILQGKNLKHRKVLFTGQAFQSLLLKDNLRQISSFNQVHVNDYDFFIFDYNYIQGWGDENIFETIEQNTYDDLRSTSYGYNIVTSEKFSFFKNGNKLPEIINTVFYNDLYSEYDFKDIDLKSRLIMSGLSTLSYFDITSVQAGLLINLDTMKMDFLYTEDYYNYLINDQIDINKKRISPKTIERYVSKFDDASKYFEKLYHNENKLKTLIYIFNKINEAAYSIFNEYSKDFKKYIYKVDNLYKMIQEFDSAISKLKGDGKIENNTYMYDFRYDKNFKPKYLLKDKKLLSEIILTLMLSEVNFKIEKIYRDNIELLNIKDSDKDIINKIDLLINIFGDGAGYKGILKKETKFNNLIKIFNAIINLALLSEKKLKKLIEFCEKNNMDISGILLLISIEPKLLNLNLNNLKKIHNMHFGHSLKLFEIPFKFSLNPFKLANIYIYIYDKIEEKLSELNKKLKSDFNMNSMIGKLERVIEENLSRILNSTNSNLIIEIDQMVEFLYSGLEESFREQLKPFHDFEKIMIRKEENGYEYICEELITSKELKKEGHYMHHCVGGYDLNCKEFRSIIFRLYRNDKHSLAKRKENEFRYTFELNLPDLKLVQIKGKRNKEVENNHLELSQLFINEVIIYLKSTRADFYKENCQENKYEIDDLFY